MRNAWLGSLVLVGLLVSCGGGDDEAERRAADSSADFELDIAGLGVPVSWDEFSSPFISDIRQLTSVQTGTRRAGEGYFSPDGRRMIFQAERDTMNPFFQIFIMDMKDGAIHKNSLR